MLVDDVARETLNAVGSNAGLLQAIKWVSQRYRQLCQSGKMRHLRVTGEVVIPRALGVDSSVDGTVSATRDSNIITGNATAEAAWASLGQDDIAGRFFRFRRVWYEIDGIEPDGSLRLKSNVAEEDSTAVSYRIVQRHTRMPVDLDSISPVMVHMRLWRPLTALSINELDQTQPERIFVAGTGPELWAEVGNDPQGVRLVEFYPYPVESEMVRFVYYKRAPELTPGTAVPEDIAIEILKAGALIDVFRFEMSQAARENRVDAAALWRNESRAQETVWKRSMEEAMAAERANEDISFILHTMGPPVPDELTWIRTARQDAISRISNFP